MYDYENEQNLLEGVQMTTSISCHYQQDISAQSQIENYEGISFTVEDEEFYLSSNEEQESVPSIDVSYNFHLSQTQTKPKSNFGKPISQKKRLNRCSAKKHLDQKKESHKKVSTIIDLDSKLVQIKCSGLLDHSVQVMQRIAQIILTEQFCSFRVYEKKLVQILKDLQFCMAQFQKQKKSLINQINLLKTDNESLKSTVNSLSAIIKDMQTSLLQYSTRNQKTASSYNFSPQFRGYSKQQKIPQVRSFSHTVNQDKQLDLQKIIQIQKKEVDSISMQDFAQFLHEIKHKLERVTYSSQDDGQAPKFYLKIIDRFKKDSIIRDWIVSVIALLFKLQNDKKESTITFFGHCSQQTEQQQTLIESFMSILSRNKHKFAKKILQSESKDRQFWFIVHSSLFTFIGILINEAKKHEMGENFRESNKIWAYKFVQVMNTLREQTQILLSQSEQKLLKKVQNLLLQINELVASRVNK